MHAIGYKVMSSFVNSVRMTTNCHIYLGIPASSRFSDVALRAVLKEDAGGSESYAEASDL